MKKGVDYIGVSAGAMVFNDKGELFLSKRSQNCKNERGHWETPGGSAELGETLEQAVRREMLEEYGIDIEVIEQFPAADHLIPAEGQHWVATTFLAHFKSGQEPKIMEPDKCDEIGWFALDKLPSPLSLITKADLKEYDSRQHSADQFIQDTYDVKNSLLQEAARLTNVIDTLERSTDEHIAYYAYLKDFLINSGCLCDDIVRGSHNNALLLAMIGTRTLLEDAINVRYLATKTVESERMAIAADWFRITNDPQAYKNKIDGKSVKDRAYAASDDTKVLHDGAYVDFCNYTHSTAQRAIVNIEAVRPLLAKKTAAGSVKAYANVVMCVADIIGEDVLSSVTDTAKTYFDKYRESVTQAPLPELDENGQAITAPKPS